MQQKINMHGIKNDVKKSLHFFAYYASPLFLKFHLAYKIIYREQRHFSNQIGFHFD